MIHAKLSRKTLPVSIFLILTLLFFLSPITHTQAAESENTDSSLKKVRVGYLIYPGYQEGEGDAPKSGYGYEYL